MFSFIRLGCIHLLLIGFQTVSALTPHRCNIYHNRQIYSISTPAIRHDIKPYKHLHQSSTTITTTLNLFPLIAESDTWGNVAVLSSVSALAQLLGKTTPVGKLLGPPVTAMALAFFLGSVGVLSPGGSTGAKAIQLFSLQLATPMLLLGVNLQDCKKNGGPVLIAFLIASIATWMGSILAICIPTLSHSMIGALGEDAWKIAAALLAKNIGGGINYIAVCQTLQASSNAIAAGLCVDNIFALIYFPLSSAFSSGRPDAKSSGNSNEVDPNNEICTDMATPPITTITNSSTMELETISRTIALASVITWLGEKLGGASGALPISTLLTILFTSICPGPTSQLRSTGETLGTSLLYLFFATAGAPGISIADSVKSSFLPISAFLLVLYTIHSIILILCRYVAERLYFQRRKSRGGTEIVLEEDWDAQSPFLPQRLLVASSAAIGGPATAVALAQANGWSSLIGPAVLVGNLGYAIATFCGLIFYAAIKNRI